MFNINEDPHEQKNLAPPNPDKCREGAAILEQWHKEMMETMPQGYNTDPMEIVLSEGGPFHAKGHLKEYCKRLEETGRGYAVAELKKKHPREFED